MGRRSMPKGRFSLRRGLRSFEPLEVVIAVASFVVFGVGLMVSISEDQAMINLADRGRCVDAEVVDAGSFNSLRLGRSADLTYAVDGVRYYAVVRYDSDQPLRVHSSVEVCTDRADPATFAVSDRGVVGDSTNLWLRGVIANPISAVGLVVFGLVIGKHEWRFHDDETPEAGAGSPDADRPAPDTS